MRSSGQVRLLLGAIWFCFGCPGVTHAQTGSAARNDIAAVRAAAKEYLSAVQRGDQSALRKIWTSTGDYVDASGQRLKAEELIQQMVAEPAPKSLSDNQSASETQLRFITPDVAIEDGVADTTGAVSDVVGRFTAVWVKRDGRWLLDSVREAAVATAPPVNEHLAPLAWLVGEWTGKAEAGDILVSAHWSDAGNFIVREFVFCGKGGEKVGGTQRIGWDPVANQIKSWSFDSQGGVGKDTWRRDGNRWIVESNDVTADGKTVTTSSSYIQGGDGRFVWESAGGSVAGTQLKPVRVEFVRASDE